MKKSRIRVQCGKTDLKLPKNQEKMNKLGNTVPPIYISLNHNIVRTKQARAIL